MVCMLAAGASPLRAQVAGDFGAGVMLGRHTGVTAKYWMTEGRALDAGIGIENNLSLYGDILWHSWRVLPQPSQGKLPVYLGIGLESGNSDRNDFGLRAVAGVAYWFPRNPLEVFAEIVPVLHFNDDKGANVSATIGGRYYFEW